MAQGHPPAAAMASYIGVQGCRLPGLKPSKSPPSSARKRYPQQAQHAPLPHAKATTRPQQWLKGTPPAAAMGIRASYRRSRLPFARPQTLQTLQRSAQLRREQVPHQAFEYMVNRRMKLSSNSSVRLMGNRLPFASTPTTSSPSSHAEGQGQERHAASGRISSDGGEILETHGINEASGLARELMSQARR